MSKEIIYSNDSSNFVILNDVMPDAIYDIRYYSDYNFVGKRINGYEQPYALLTVKAANALKKVNGELLSKGYMLKIYDAYRPVSAVKHFVKWAKDLNDIKMKDYFYKEVDKSDLFKLGYISDMSSHSRGSTIDLTLYDIKNKIDVDMGSTFDYFGDISHSNYTKITDKQYKNRMFLKEIMIKHGFLPYIKEWWHFTLKNEPFPNTYFDFPVNKKSIKRLSI